MSTDLNPMVHCQFNSFIDYFKESTEIYQGMKVIDQKLGGTTPLDIIVRFEDADLAEPAAAESEETYLEDEEDAELMELLDEETKSLMQSIRELV